MFSHSLLRAIGALLCGLLVLSVVAITPPAEEVQADPVTLLVTTLITATAVVTYDYFSCGLNWIWGCPQRERSGGRGGGGNRIGNDDPFPFLNTNPPQNNTGGGEVPIACSSSTANACGMYGTGFVVGGVCNATPPSNSQCPVPNISEGFYADPARVRAGNTTTLYWDVANATVCSLVGGGLSLSSLGIVGETQTLEIEATTVFALTCQNGTDGGPEASEQTTVTVVPSYQEI